MLHPKHVCCLQIPAERGVVMLLQAALVNVCLAHSGHVLHTDDVASPAASAASNIVMSEVQLLEMYWLTEAELASSCSAVARGFWKCRHTVLSRQDADTVGWDTGHFGQGANHLQDIFCCCNAQGVQQCDVLQRQLRPLGVEDPV